MLMPQHVGAQFWIKWNDDIGNAKYFLLPITNYLIENREGCLNSFVKSCKASDLGTIPVNP